MVYPGWQGGVYQEGLEGSTMVGRGTQGGIPTTLPPGVHCPPYHPGYTSHHGTGEDTHHGTGEDTTMVRKKEIPTMIREKEIPTMVREKNTHHGTGAVHPPWYRERYTHPGTGGAYTTRVQEAHIHPGT